MGARLSLHLAVLLWGFTAILGAEISLSGLVLVWYRLLLALPGFAVVLLLRRRWQAMSVREMSYAALVGIVLALHWVLFFEAIHRAGASVTLVCLASSALMAALLEAPLHQRRPQWLDVACGAAIFGGIACLGVGTAPWQGIGIALVSTLLAVVYSLLNKRIAGRYPAMQLNALQMLAALLFCTPLVLLAYPSWPLPATGDWPLLAVLAWLCTVLAYELGLAGLAGLTAFEYMLIVNLEPVYGVVLAALLLHETQWKEPAFVLGGSICLLCVLAYPVLKRRLGRKAEKVSPPACE